MADVRAIQARFETIWHEIPNPVQAVREKVRQFATRFFGYLLRIIVFQLGEINKPSARMIIRAWQRWNSDPREVKPIEPPRLEQSRELLAFVGGKEVTLNPADGQARIQCMTFTSTAFIKAFLDQGAKVSYITKDGHQRKILMYEERENPRVRELADKFSFPVTPVTGEEGKEFQAVLLPEQVRSHVDTPTILHCHSPGRSMYMDRKLIGLHLGAGYNFATFDPRGTIHSTGEATEGGYYLDADAVYQHVTQTLHVDPRRLYVSGYCKGAGMAAYLKKKYHHLGVHYIAHNPFTSMEEVIRKAGFLGRLAVRYGLSAIQSKDPATLGALHSPQDGFNNVAKFTGLPYRPEARFIFVDTDPDLLMPRGSVQTIVKAIRDAGSVHQITRVHEDPNGCKHTDPPLEDPDTFHRYTQVVT